MPIPALDAILNASRLTLLPAKPFDPSLFALGEILSVQWAPSPDPQRVLIQLKGREMVAEASFPLPEQAAFQVRVEQLEPRLVLKLLLPNPGDAVSQGLLKKYWAGDPPLENLREAWEALERIQGPSLPKAIQDFWAGTRERVKTVAGWLADRPDPQALGKVIEQSGLNLEHTLRRVVLENGVASRPVVPEEDLKGLFLKMKAQLEKVSPEAARELQPILQKIELYQLLNAGEGDPGRLLLLIPLLFPEGLRWSEIMFSGDRGGGQPSADREQGLLFLLDMPALGKLQIEIRIREKQIYGRFKTADPRIGAFLEENLSRLKVRLGVAGYTADLDIRVVGPEQLRGVLPARLEDFPDSLVSLVV